MNPTLRVLHIVSGDLWAGAEAQAYTLMSHLAQMPYVQVGAVVMNEGMLADKLRSIGIGVHIIDERKVSPFRIFADLRGILTAWRPDLIHTHREKENILGSLANRTCRNVPSVRTVHGGREHSEATGWQGVRRNAVEALDRWCGSTLQRRIIAVTADLAAKLSSEFPPERIVVIENGVDIEAAAGEAQIAEFRAGAPGTTHIGMVGRLVKVKRVDLFIEMATLLARGIPRKRWKFHVFGDGPLRAELEGLSRRVNMSHEIIFHGHRQDIAVCMRGLDALVICSDHEGMPMTALEAAALGIPTVAHAVGGLPDVVPLEFLVTKHDAYGYRDGILRALDADGRTRARDRAQEILPNFSARRNAERVHVLYKQLLAERLGSDACGHR